MTPNIKHKKLNSTDVVQIILVTAVAYFLSLYLVIDIANISTYISTNADAEMSDLYNAIADKRNVQTLNNDIVIVSSDSCKREDIVTIIHKLGAYDVKAIGLDLTYQDEEPSDSAFISEVNLLGKVVLPYRLQIKDNDSIAPLYYETFKKAHKAKTGYVNLETYDLRGVIRSYRAFINIDSTYTSFAAAIAETGNASNKNYTNTDSIRLIYFPSIKFEVVRGMDLTGNSNDSTFEKTFNGKYVIIGDVENIKDKFTTPIDEEMAGVEVHAYILNTIINKLSPKVTPGWICWLIATLVCFAFITFNVWLDKRNNKLGYLVRILQIIMLILFIIIGVKLFVNNNIYIDFAPTMLMVSFGIISNDILISGCEVARWIKTKCKSKSK